MRHTIKTKRCSKCHINKRKPGQHWCGLCYYLYHCRKNKTSRERAPWSQDDIQLLTSSTHLGIADHIIARDLKRGVRSIANKRYHLGLKKEIKDFPTQSTPRVAESHFGSLIRNLQANYTIGEIAELAGIAKSAIYGASNKQSKATLSAKSINLIGAAMELTNDKINQLISAHNLDKQELGRRWIK